MEAASHTLAQKLYASQQQAAGAAGGGEQPFAGRGGVSAGASGGASAGTEGAGEEDVIDADFEVKN